MNYTCSNDNRIYSVPSSQSNLYKGGVLIINNIPFKTVESSLYLSHKTGDCTVIDNHKYSSYERYLYRLKRMK